MRLAASQELHSYWNLLRGGRCAPERSEIDPAAIRGVLADTFILEVDIFRRYPIRIAGTRTSSLFARELKGSAFLDLWRPPDQRDIAAMLASVAAESNPMLAGVAADPRCGQPLDLELLLLPLRHHGKTQARILGALSPVSLPSWIGLLPAGPAKLLSFRVLGRSESGFEKRAPRARDESAEIVKVGQTTHIDRRGHLFVFTNTAR